MALERLDIDNASLDEHESVGERQNWTTHLPRPWSQTARQGDPLSPFLFVIVMEVLNALIIEADRQGQLTPLPGNAIRHRASIYADDLVLFLAPTALDCACIR